ncbi:MAG: 30S ribosomal protein S8 [Minisyncoccia bacterium]
MTDPISDMLTRIRNAQAVKKEIVSVPFSQLKWSILDILKQNGFIKDIEKIGRGENKNIEIKLKYRKDGTPRINILNRVSKPSRRIYVGTQDVWNFKHGTGLLIISTSKGMMNDKQAKKEKLGGEVILEIW